VKTLSAPETEYTARGWETVAELRHVLSGLGADDDLLRRIVLRADLAGRQYVSVPPLPIDIVAHLARLIPGR
jgi:hypothetical protein